ncbi:MAG: tyrosine-type recombinase/integrase [Patescibacteria group bacterium]|nr:tyrosine-type recombinase/integrase [Patescibacteria group bacterium]
MEKTIYLEKYNSDKLEAFLNDFKNHINNTDRGRSARLYVGDISRFAQWFTNKHGSFNAGAVSPLDLVEYRGYLQQHGGRTNTGAAPATVNRALVSLKIFFSWLVKSGKIKYSPAEDIKQEKEASPPAPKWLTRNEQAALFRKVKEGNSIRDEAIITLMLHAGLRVSEVCNLKREDIQISARKGKVNVWGKGKQVPGDTVECDCPQNYLAVARSKSSRTALSK